MAHDIAEGAAQRALTDILEQSGRPLEQCDNVTIAGSEPTLPSGFPLAAVTAGTLAACGLAVDDLWRLRGGARQHVSAPLRKAAASLRSAQYLGFEDGDGPAFFDPLFGYYPTGDQRWVQLHTNFKHTRDRALEVLQAPPERERVACAVLRWKACELEQALTDAGACASFVRTAQEWSDHPHAKAVDGLPLLEILRIGDAPPAPLPAGDRPLSGIRVLDLTRVLAGPTCGRTLAEQGAQVMRIGGPHLPSVERCVIDTGHGKRNAYVDLREATGLAALTELVRDAQVFCQAYRPGALAQRGLSPQDLAALRPGIVYVSLSAYGHQGPWAARRGYDTLVQCTTGIAHEQGGGAGAAPGVMPSHLPGAALDYISGYLAAFGAMRALHLRATMGGSYLVRVSLCQTAHWLKSFPRTAPEAHANLGLQSAEDVSDLMVSSDTAWGRLQHLGPVLDLSETPGRWTCPASPLGTHPPQWLD